jgi:hypothetical protein
MIKTYQIIWEGNETTAGAHFDRGDVIDTCATLDWAEMTLYSLFERFKGENKVAFSIKTIYTPDVYQRKHPY